jgi:excisionase family DNA binding protein
MITAEGLKSLSDQITEKVIKAINVSKFSNEIVFMNIEETAKLINLTKPTVYGLVHQKNIPFHKKGKKLYFLKSEILTWIQSGKRQSKSEIENKADEYMSKNRFI